jgi:hypothetical protein
MVEAVNELARQHTRRMLNKHAGRQASYCADGRGPRAAANDATCCSGGVGCRAVCCATCCSGPHKGHAPPAIVEIKPMPQRQGGAGQQPSSLQQQQQPPKGLRAAGCQANHTGPATLWHRANWAPWQLRPAASADAPCAPLERERAPKHVGQQPATLQALH